MRVLVTGGAGFIGSHLVERLVNRGDDVLVVDDLSAGSGDNLDSGLDLVEMDIADPSLADVVKRYRPDIISHWAAQKAVQASMDDPVADARTNIVGGLNLMKAAVDADVSQLIYATTGGALYEPDNVPSDEDHPIRPISAYGLSKWTLEQYLKMLAPPAMLLKVLRIANVYGPRQDPSGEAGAVSILAGRMLRDEPVTIYGDGEQTRDLVYVRDVVDAHESAVRAPRELTVNVSSGTGTSINELFGKLAVETGYKRAPAYEPRRPGDLERSVLDNMRAKSLLGWSPKTPLDRGLSETVEWLRVSLLRFDHLRPAHLESNS